MALELSTESGRPVRDPDADAIARALRGLGADSGFAILERSKSDYIQAAVGEGGGLLLEYHEPTGDNHFKARRADVSRDEAIRAFQQFARGESGWQRPFEWEEMRLVGKKGCRGTAQCLLALFIAPAAMLVYWLA